MNYNDAIRLVNKIATETSTEAAYRVLQSRTYRESLRIPNAIWKRLEPALQEKLRKIREEIESKANESDPTIPAQSTFSASRAPTNQGYKLPAQYPSMVHHATTALDNMILEEDPSTDNDSDSDTIVMSYHSTTNMRMFIMI